MFDILFARTFIIVGVMLLITAGASYLNKKANIKKISWWPIILIFVLLFAIEIFIDFFPLNLILTGCFAFVMGWMIAPSIKMMGNNFKTKKFLKDRGIKLNKNEKLNEEQLIDLDNYLLENRGNDEWNKIVAQAMLSTAIAVLATASLAFLSNIDFSFLGIFLFIALFILIIMSILNIYIFKSKIFDVIKAYFGVIIFTFYLIYDFSLLEKMKGDESWATAINIAVNIYLDIINLFLYLLQLFGDSN